MRDRLSTQATLSVKARAVAGDPTTWVYHAGIMALQQKRDAATPTERGAAYTYRADGVWV